MTADIPVRSHVAALILAAGMSRRMGGINKLLSPDSNGRTMVGRVAQAARASRAGPIFAVIGYEAAQMRAALADPALTTIYAPDYATGLAASLRAGIAALPDDADGVIVLLADMPFVSAAMIDRLIAAYDPMRGRSIVVPSSGGRRGNPVLWDRRYFAEIQALQGDAGARLLLQRHASAVLELELDTDAILTDVDTPDALARLG